MTAIEAVASQRDDISEGERKVRVDLAACYRLVARNGWDTLIYTHISAAVPGEEGHYLVNPFGMYFHEVTASNLVKVDVKGKIVGKSPHIVNPAAFIIHGAIHRARPGMGCVLHLHTVAGSGVACQKQGLLPISQDALLFHGNLAYHDYEGIAVDEGECERLVADLGGKSALILRNHGTLVVGETVAKAFVTMTFLERACQVQVAALAGGAEVIVPTPEVQKIVTQQAQAAFQAAGFMEWAGLLRTLDAEDPGYKD